jgi:hypothetical protein
MMAMRFTGIFGENGLRARMLRRDGVRRVFFGAAERVFFADDVRVFERELVAGFCRVEEVRRG